MQGAHGAEGFSIFPLEDHPEFETLVVLGVGAEVVVDYLLRGRVQAVEDSMMTNRGKAAPRNSRQGLR